MANGDGVSIEAQRRHCACIFESISGPPIQFCSHHAMNRDELEAARVEIEQLRAVIAEFDGLVAESEGVSGLHLNGDIASWDWLLSNVWLEKYEELPPETTKNHNCEATGCVYQTHVLGSESITRCMFCDEPKPVEDSQ